MSSNSTERFTERLLPSLLGTDRLDTYLYPYSSFSSRPVSRYANFRIPIDVVNEEKTIYIYAELPGVEKKDIEIDVLNNVITIIAKRNKPYGTTSNLLSQEISYGTIRRKITVPICITNDRTVSTKLLNGLLKIKIDKLIEEENRFSVNIE